MEFSKLHLYVLIANSTISLLLVTAKNETSINNLDPKNRIAVNVGLILDFNSSAGLVANSCIAMALSDFYSTNPHYTTRLALHPKNANDVLSAASAGGPSHLFIYKNPPVIYLDICISKYMYVQSPLYDALAGDITIRADREGDADFSLPYLESGVVMVVRVEPDRLKNIWIFLKPLSWDLWLTIVVAAIFIGLVLRMLERRVNPQRQLGMLFLFPLAALAFPERNMVGNKWAKFVLVVWLFMAYILMQSYTANLSSILTVSQLRPSADNPVCAGYQKDSFVGDMLKKMNIKGIGYATMEEYDEALSKGCKNGGVDVIFDEIPYIKLFLHKYGSKYTVVGPTYNTGGFAFPFRAGSDQLRPFSKAILTLIEHGKIQDIQKKYFGVGYLSQRQDKDIAGNGASLTSYSFAGLFAVTAFLTLLAVVCSECSFAISRHRNQNVASISRVHSIEFEATHDVSPETDPQELKEVVILGQEAQSYQQHSGDG